jgi:hypothetical protein
MAMSWFAGSARTVSTPNHWTTLLAVWSVRFTRSRLVVTVRPMLSAML